MTYRTPLESRTFGLFLASIKSPKTKEVYTYSLHEFMKFSKIIDYDDIPKSGTDKIQTLLENWVMDLAKRGLKAATIRGKLGAVVLFLEMNKLAYHKRVLRRLIPSDDYITGGALPFTNEEIQKMIAGTTKLRSKAIIHFFASTGVRPASITDPVLRMKHIEDMPNGCKSVKIYDGSREGYWAFLTPEAAKSLDNYLNSRRRNGEILSLETPVFSNIEKLPEKVQHNYLSAKAVHQIVSNIIKAAGIERTKSGNRYDKATIYGFRKRFNTILKLNNEVNSNIAEKLMAHKNGLDGIYLKPTRDECFNEFQKAIPQLMVSSEARDKFKIIQLEAEKSEVASLKEDLQNMKKVLEDEVMYRAAVTHYYAYGRTDELKEVDPEVIEFWGYWEALMASGNLPKVFSTPKEQLIEIAKHYPKLSKLIGKKGENLVPNGGLWELKHQ